MNWPPTATKEKKEERVFFFSGQNEERFLFFWSEKEERLMLPVFAFARILGWIWLLGPFGLTSHFF